MLSFIFLFSVVSAEFQCKYHDPPDVASVTNWLNEEFFSEYSLADYSYVPGALVTMSVNGSDSFKPYFFDNYRVHSDYPLNSSSLFPVAQVTEVISAITILERITRDDNWVLLDRPAGEVLPWISKEHRDLTLRQLLWHVSGIDISNIGIWSHDPKRTEGKWGTELHHLILPHRARPAGLLPTATPYDMSLAAAMFESAACDSADCDFEKLFNQTLTSLGLSGSTSRIPIFKNGWMGDKSYTLGHLGNHRPMINKNKPYTTPMSRLWPSCGLWMTADDYARLVRRLSAGMSDDSGLSAAVDAAFFGHGSRLSVLSHQHPLESLVPGVGAVFSEREVNGFTIRWLRGSHPGFAAHIYCLTESDPIKGGSVHKDKSFVVGDPYRICLGLVTPVHDDAFPEYFINSFFNKFYTTHSGCGKRNETLQPSTGRIPSKYLKTALVSTRFPRTTVASVILPYHEEHMSPQARNGAPIALHLPDSLVSVHKGTNFSALPRNWLDSVYGTRNGSQLHPHDRDPCTIRLKRDGTEAAQQALLFHDEGGPEGQTQTYTTVYRNIDVDPELMDTMHVVLLTPIDLQCQLNSNYTDTCSDALTASTGPHSAWYRERVRFVVYGGTMYEQVERLHQRGALMGVCITLVVLSTVIVPTIFLLLYLQRKRQAKREEELFSGLSRPSVSADLTSIHSTRHHDLSIGETEGSSDYALYRPSLETAVVDPGFSVRTPIFSHKSDDFWPDNFAFLNEDESEAAQAPPPAVCTIPKFASITLPSVIASGALIDLICFFSLRYVYESHRDPIYPTLPASYFGVPGSAFIALILPYVGSIAVLVAVVWLVRVVAFDTGIISSFWMLNACVGLLANLFLIYELHYFNMFSFGV